MKFHINLMGVELISVGFSWPARGVYPVPDFFYNDTIEEEFDFTEEED